MCSLLNELEITNGVDIRAVKGHEKHEETILIVDDTEFGRESLKLALRDQPYNLTLAVDGEDALAKVKEIDPDLILLDVIMPGIDGLEVCKRIRANPDVAEVPIVMVTGLDDQEMHIKGIEAGADDFISKISNPWEIQARVRSILRLNRYRRLNTERAKFERLIALSPDGILIVDDQGIIRLANNALMSILGAESDEIILGQELASFIAPKNLDDFNDCFESVISNASKVLRFETTFKGLDGQTTPVEVNIGHFTWDGEAAVQLIVRDITEHKRLLEVLEQSKQKELYMKDRFLSHVSHELRSPVATIYQFISIMLDGLAGDIYPEQREYLEITLKNAEQLNFMIKDLLEVTRSRTDTPVIERGDVSLEKIIGEALDCFHTKAASKSINLSADVPHALPHVSADTNRLKQILTNLIENGIKFTPENGNITVRARVYEKDPGYLCVSVADTGKGIKNEDKSKIFNELYQVKDTIDDSRNGLGLGLFITKDLVSRHDGQIWVESELGQGSTFFFTLPISGKSCQRF